MSTIRFLRAAKIQLEPQPVALEQLINEPRVRACQSPLAEVVVALPDCAYAAKPLAVESLHGVVPATAVLFRPRIPQPDSYPQILCVNETAFYTQVRCTLREPSLIWVRIDPAFAATLLKGESSNHPPRALLANALIYEQTAAELHQLVTLRAGYPFLEIHSIEPLTATPVALQSLSALTDGVATEALPQFAANSALQQAMNHESKGELSQAIQQYNRAYRLGCERAMDYELRCHGALAAPLREKFPSVFQAILVGEGLRSLTTLRAAVEEFPLAANAILSYLLRSAQEPVEGLHASERALALEPLQSDVLNNQWFYYFQLGNFEQALATAKKHLALYPTDLAAATNYVDALTLLARHEVAIAECDRYLCLSENLDQSIKQLCKTYEAAGAWELLEERLDSILAIHPNPSCESMVSLAEVYTERYRFEHAEALLERALTIHPGNESVVLAYARFLARAEREGAAEQLLKTVLADTNRNHTERGEVLLLTLLAEILRRNSRAIEALDVFESRFPAPPLALTTIVGPLPALEYAETLLATGDPTTSQSIAAALQQQFPEDPFVLDFINYLESLSPSPTR